MMDLFEVDIPDDDKNVIRRNLRAAFKANVVIISFGIFSYAFSQKFGLSDNIIEFFGTAVFDIDSFLSNVIVLTKSRVHEVALFILTFFWYWVYREGAYNEVDLLGSLHSEARLPDRFEAFGRFSVVLFLATGLTICFVAMAVFVNYYPLFILFMLMAYIQDMYGNRSIIQQLRNLQQQNNIDIIDDAAFPRIRDMREVCYNYWIKKEQLERISGFFMLNVASLLIYVFLSSASNASRSGSPVQGTAESPIWFIHRFRNPELDHYDVWILLCYGITMGSILGNEHIMRRWRSERNRQIREVRAKDYSPVTPSLG